MTKAIDTAIETLAKLITTDVKSHEAMQFAQAALSLAHTKQVLQQVSKT